MTIRTLSLSFFPSLLSCLSLTLVACAGDAGPAGPAGPGGAAGDKGADGVAGKDGAEGPAGPGAKPSAEAPSAVYTLSNDPTQNEVVVYARATDGSLSAFGSFSTGGRGTGAGLGDQGALVYDAKRKAFFAVNAGDDSISMLSLRVDGTLALVSKVPSGGVTPISLSLHDDTLYVVNAGDAKSNAQISGFKVAAGGLLPIPASTQPLSAPNPAPAQIQFSPDGAVLVVTEKGTNMIDTFTVDASGVAGVVNAQPASGMTPFGFAFAGKRLVVSEAFGGGAGLGATSSYALDADGALTPVSRSSASSQTAPCWVAVAGNHAFVTSTGSNTVTSYAVAADGTLTMSNADGVAAATGDGPADDSVSPAGDWLYTRNGRAHSLSVFAVAADGSLTKKPDFVGIPLSAVGLVVR